MASITNLTVKKADNVTDITYTALVPSSGDNNPARWRCETVGSASAHKPSLSFVTRFNGAKTARWAELNSEYPVIATNSTTGITSVVNKVPSKSSFVLPVNVNDSILSEAITQHINCLVALRNGIASGYAPT